MDDFVSEEVTIEQRSSRLLRWNFEQPIDVRRLDPHLANIHALAMRNRHSAECCVQPSGTCAGQNVDFDSVEPRQALERIDEGASRGASHGDVVLLARGPVCAAPHVQRGIVLRSVRGAAVRAVAAHPLGVGTLAFSGGPYLAEDVVDSDRYG